MMFCKSSATSLLFAIYLTVPASAVWQQAQFSAPNPEIGKWFDRQVVPGDVGKKCCSTADGIRAQEDIRYDEKGVGHYWTRFTAISKKYDSLTNTTTETEIDSDWMQVPDNTVLRSEPNFYKLPVVWYYWDLNGELMIRCYAPGVGM